ncbi:ATP-binding protein [Nocardioides sambongensis]|uniref:ATP-binding protein n=1 Tax=Nocardioides sambongensis TaxID=2589074 RepID=UPI00112AD1AE|nr:ATP-binding protein [Nocardioides sambongensis]
MSARSPFRPSFGSNPPLVVGRDAVLDELADALDGPPGSAGRAALITGNRGIGKTVVLNEAEALARERSWLVISETATTGLLDRMTADGLPELADLLRQAPASRPRVSGISLPAGLGGVELELPEERGPGGLRRQLNALTDALDEHGTGIMITLDEVHARSARDDVAQLAAVVQHAFREERPVAFAAAGLPAAVQDLLTADVSTFLRRARRFVLEPLSPVAAEEALRVPILEHGRGVDDAEVSTMAAATQGYPYLVQVIGDRAWRQEPGAPTITADHVERGVRDAIREAGFALHEPAVNDLSETDRQFIAAMAVDRGESAIADIEQRLGRDHGYVSRYRSRLIVAGVVEPSRRGYLRFTIPYLAEFLRARADFL